MGEEPWTDCCPFIHSYSIQPVPRYEFVSILHAVPSYHWRVSSLLSSNDSLKRIPSCALAFWSNNRMSNNMKQQLKRIIILIPDQRPCFLPVLPVTSFSRLLWYMVTKKFLHPHQHYIQSVLQKFYHVHQ